MAKELSELIKKVNPAVVEAARAEAANEISKMHSEQLRQIKSKIASLKSCVQNFGGKLKLDIELSDGSHISNS